MLANQLREADGSAAQPERNGMRPAALTVCEPWWRLHPSISRSAQHFPSPLDRPDPGESFCDVFGTLDRIQWEALEPVLVVQVVGVAVKQSRPRDRARGLTVLTACMVRSMTPCALERLTA